MLAGILEIQMVADCAMLLPGLKQAQDATASSMAAVEKSVEGAKKALEALGIGLSLASFAGLIKGAIDSAEHLQNLRIATNLSVQDLAGLSLLAKQSGMGLDDLTRGINKMSVEMGKAPDKFRALGVTAKDGTGALKQFADIFNNLTDIQQRNALAQAVFKKSWAEMAPLLSKGSEGIDEAMKKGAELSRVTAQLAADSKEFNDKWVELTGTGGLLNAQVAPLLPLLISLADDLLELRAKTAGADDGFHPLAETFRALLVLGGNVAYVFKEIGNDLGAMAAMASAFAHGDFAGLQAIKVANVQDAKDARDAFDAWEKKVMAAGTALATVGDTSDAMSRKLASASAADQKAATARAAAFLAWKDTTDAQASEYTKIIKSIDERVNAGQAELSAGRALNDYEKFEIKTLAEMRNEKVALSAVQKQSILGHLAEAKAIYDESAARKAEQNNNANYAKEWLKDLLDMSAAEVAREAERDNVNRAIADETRALSDNNDMLQMEASLLGATDQERAVALGNLQIEIDLKNKIRKINEDLLLSEDARNKAISDETANAALAKSMLAEREALKEQIKLIDQIQSEGKNLWDILWQGGSDTFKKLGASLKTFLLDLLYQMTAKQWIISLTASATAGGAAAQGVAGSVGGSVLSGVGSKLFGGVGSAFMGGYSGSAAVGASFASTVGGGLATDAMGATVIADAASATVATGLGAGIEAGLAAVPVYGWIALGALAIYSFLSGSKGGPKIDGVYGPIQSNIGLGTHTTASDAAAQTTVAGLQSQYNIAASAMGSKGGAQFGVGFSTDPQGTAPTMLDVSAQDASGKSLYHSYNDQVGRSQDELTKAMADATTQALFEALKGSNLSKPFQDFFDGIATDASTAVKAAALQTASDVATYTSQVSSLGGVFLQLKDVSVQARASMIAAAGGLQALITATSTYYQNFYSPEEQRVNTAKSILATVNAAGAGLSLDDVLHGTRAQFRAVVDSLDLSTAAGQRMYVAMMSVAGAFASITPAASDTATTTNTLATSTDTLNTSLRTAADIANERIGLENQLLQLQGNTKELRARELAALDESNRSLQLQIWSMQDLTAATDASYNALTRAVDAQKTSIQLTLTLAQEQVTAITSLMDLLKTQIAALYGQVASTTSMGAQAGQSFIAKALAAAQSTGYLPDSTQLGDAITAARAGMGADSYKTAFEQNRDQLILANKLEAIQKIAGPQLTTAQQAVKDAQDQLAALDALLKTEKDQLDAMRGVDVSVLSVADAVTKLHEAMFKESGKTTSTASSGAGSFTGGGGSAGSSGGTASIDWADFQSYFDTYGSNAGGPGRMAWYLKYYGQTEASAAAALNLDPGMVNAYFDNAGIPRFASGGYHAGGWAVVGENGPELANMGPSQIYSSAQSSALVDNSDVVAAIDRLSVRLSNIESNTGNTAFASKKTSDLLVRVAQDGNSLQTTAV